MNIIEKNNIFNYKASSLEKFYFSILIIFIISSIFINIPTDTTNIGISSTNLAIGDRSFYINNSLKGYGYPNYSGNILYPTVLKIITSICDLFGADEYSKLWNTLNIFITSLLSLITLRLLRASSSLIFNERISKISCLIYILNPYTYYYSLSGGLTNYIVVGVSLIMYLICYLYKKGGLITNKHSLITNIVINISCIYLSLLRPSGGIFGTVFLIIFLYKYIRIYIQKKSFNKFRFANIFITVLGLLFVSHNLKTVFNYSFANVNIFLNEKGYYFGYSRELLRSKLKIDNLTILENLKMALYYLSWKITDFVSGISDIRDTHKAQIVNNLFPFILRTTTGIFFLFPINLFSFLGILLNIRLIIKTELWIVLISSFAAISPSLLGVAMSRYLIMFFPPFILFAAKMINDTLQGADIT